MDVNVLVVGVIVSSIGMGMFIYGKKTVRMTPLIFGVVLMIIPFLFSSVLMLTLVTIALLVAAWLLREQ